MKHVIIATCNEQPDIHASDQIMVDSFGAFDVRVSAAPWNGPFAPFTKADLVVIRTTWDYFSQFNEFLAWFDQLEAAGVDVANSLEVLRWNTHKNYLFDMQEAGVRTIPMVAVASDRDAILEATQSHGWSRVVLKCLVSGGAMGLSRLDGNDLEQIDAALEKAAPYSAEGLVLQPYRRSIETDGELSLIFINGVFTHGVRKTPADQDFRIQSEYGGQYTRYTPDQNVLQAAEHALSFSPGMPQDPPLYARVDGVLHEGNFELMELELTEPELMFGLSTTGAVTMALAIANRVGAQLKPS